MPIGVDGRCGLAANMGGVTQRVEAGIIGEAPVLWGTDCGVKLAIGGPTMWQLAVYGPISLFGESLICLLKENGYPEIKWIGKSDPIVCLPADENVDLILIDENQQSIREIVESLIPHFPNTKYAMFIESDEDDAVMQSALLAGVSGCIEKTGSLAMMISLIEAVLHGQLVYPAALSDWLLPTIEDYETAAPQRRSDRQQAAWFDSSISRAMTLVPSRQPGDWATTSHASSRNKNEDYDLSAPDEAAPVSQASHTVRNTPRPSISTRELQILELLTMGAPNKVIARRLDIAEATVKSHLKNLLKKINVNNRTQAAIWAVDYLPNSGSTSEGPKSETQNMTLHTRMQIV